MLGLWLAFATTVLVLRYAVLPHVPEYRADIEHAISQAIGLPVSIADVSADWQGLRPRLNFHGLKIADKANRPALSFDSVEAVIGWSSILHLDLRLHRLEIDAPVLNMRREADGKIFVAGLPINADNSDSHLSDWVLEQDRIVIRDATLQWDDAQRKAPTLALNKVNFDLRNSGSRHRFGLTAEPPNILASHIDIRGDAHGDSLQDLKAWGGNLYTELDYADLAGWRAWVDYPIELPRGKGGLRLWLSFDDGKASGVTADLALSDVAVRLDRSKPMLDLAALTGRFSAQRANDGDDYIVEGKKLKLVTQPDMGNAGGLSIGPLDFSARLGLGDDGKPERMEARFNSLDLGQLDKLADYLPLPQEYETMLDKLDLDGRIDNFFTRWDGGKARYALKGNFRNLGISSYNGLPGVRHLSGSIDGNDGGGTLTIDSRDATLSLPSVFAEADIPLQSIAAKMDWSRSGERYDVNIADLRFANADAAGSVHGSYQGRVGTAGNIDLTGQLTRADAKAVWRYLPNSVNPDARAWVKQGVTSGHTSDVKLTLKGNLDRFPFRDGGGTFSVVIKAQDATVHPAADWPEIRGIDGTVAFIGPGMKIDAQKGHILGAALSGVHAEIPDLDTHEQILTVAGQAKGETQEFLKFIEASPVGERIGHFTAPMAANGNGSLNLRLELPLTHVNDTTVSGSYLFDNNTLHVAPILPPLTAVSGRLDFTGDSIGIRDVRANLFGAPLEIKAETDKNGQINLSTEGQFNIAAMRKLYPLPLFDQLSGSGRWKGNFAIHKNDVDIRIASDLVGLSSSLPDPFNKSAATAVDFHIDKKVLPAATTVRRGRTIITAPARETQEIVFGKQVRGNSLRVAGGDTRGFLAIGTGADNAKLPASGTLLTVNLPRIDVDFWRSMFARNTNKTSARNTSSNASSFPFTQLNLKTGELIALNRTFPDASLTAQLNNGTWKSDFRSQGIAANLAWTPGTADKPGRISGRIPQLTIPNPNKQITALATPDNDSNEPLPAVSLIIDNVNLRGQNWGTVTLDAENKNGYWNAKFSVNNEDTTLTGDGRWKPDPVQHDTQLNFQLKAKSLEKLLARAGYADAIRQGTADISGNLGWNAAPFDIDYPTLNGKLKIDLGKGQFKKLDPGIGRLLGVLSLQSIPRRITLDFRDIFSEGFAFDSIKGDADINKGVMSTQELTLTGPSATVRMSGSVSLPDETQDLHVRVQPVLGDTLAVGAMIVNPAIGAAAWLAHKVLKDPIDKAFAFEYKVTGKWADPQVVKVNTGRDINKEITEEALKHSTSQGK